MRHRTHRHSLGVKKEHRIALMANMASALIRHGRIETTLAKAKALRPFTERLITLAKKGHAAETPAQRLHYYRLAISRLRDKTAAKMLFDERAQEFVDRNGGYTRIYKLMPRQNDAAPMALIELIAADDEGYTKPKRKKSGDKSSAPKAQQKEESAEAEPAEAQAPQKN
jgi:large subunit ribosomal protein L17